MSEAGPVVNLDTEGHRETTPGDCREARAKGEQSCASVVRCDGGAVVAALISHCGSGAMDDSPVRLLVPAGPQSQSDSHHVPESGEFSHE